jgi:hypothetical protein
VLIIAVADADAIEVIKEIIRPPCLGWDGRSDSSAAEQCPNHQHRAHTTDVGSSHGHSCISLSFTRWPHPADDVGNDHVRWMPLPTTPADPAGFGGAALLGGSRSGGHRRPEGLRATRKVEVNEVNA